MSITEKEKQRVAQVEAYLENWAKHVRGNVDLGYPHIALEAAHLFGAGKSRSQWPEQVEEVEVAVCCMPAKVRLAIVSYYVYRRHINSIAQDLHCGQRKVSELLDSGRARIDAWMMARMAA